METENGYILDWQIYETEETEEIFILWRDLVLAGLAAWKKGPGYGK